MSTETVILAYKFHVDEVAGICDLLVYDGNTGKEIDNIQRIVFEKNRCDAPRLHIDFIQKITRTVKKDEQKDASA